MNRFIFLLLFISAIANASFSETSRRYLSPKDMFTLLNQKFPVLKKKEHLAKYFFNANDKIPLTCWALGLRNGNTTGLVLPAIGAPATSTPGAPFVRWWGSCADQIVKKQFENLNMAGADQGLWAKYYVADVLDKFRDKGNPSQPFHRLDKEPWKSLNPRQRRAQIRFLLEEFIGPNAVIADLGLAKGLDDLAMTIQNLVPDDSTMTINQANQTLITGVILREEFLSY